MSENLQDFPVFALAFTKRLSQLLQKALGETCWSFHERFGSSCCQSLTKKEQFMNVKKNYLVGAQFFHSNVYQNSNL